MPPSVTPTVPPLTPQIYGRLTLLASPTLLRTSPLPITPSLFFTYDPPIMLYSDTLESLPTRTETKRAWMNLEGVAPNDAGSNIAALPITDLSHTTITLHPPHSVVITHEGSVYTLTPDLHIPLVYGRVIDLLAHGLRRMCFDGGEYLRRSGTEGHVYVKNGVAGKAGSGVARSGDGGGRDDDVTTLLAVGDDNMFGVTSETGKCDYGKAMDAYVSTSDEIATRLRLRLRGNCDASMRVPSAAPAAPAVCVPQYL